MLRSDLRQRLRCGTHTGSSSASVTTTVMVSTHFPEEQIIEFILTLLRRHIKPLLHHSPRHRFPFPFLLQQPRCLLLGAVIGRTGGRVVFITECPLLLGLDGIGIPRFCCEGVSNPGSPELMPEYIPPPTLLGSMIKIVSRKED
ncbi:uncharacterized protein G2W53_043463 [Senna tora]|uniref:Uncharacterized protein n=1 Tax=Senna tora TaxID=362788 RepID=A0A834W092_9FABA|nr:uncharacterized protein G2W53_043463 [Senna tora]